MTTTCGYSKRSALVGVDNEIIFQPVEMLCGTLHALLHASDGDLTGLLVGGKVDHHIEMILDFGNDLSLASKNFAMHLVIDVHLFGDLLVEFQNDV